MVDASTTLSGGTFGGSTSGTGVVGTGRGGAEVGGFSPDPGVPVRGDVHPSSRINKIAEMLSLLRWIIILQV